MYHKQKASGKRQNSWAIYNTQRDTFPKLIATSPLDLQLGRPRLRKRRGWENWRLTEGKAEPMPFWDGYQALGRELTKGKREEDPLGIPSAIREDDAEPWEWGVGLKKERGRKRKERRECRFLLERLPSEGWPFARRRSSRSRPRVCWWRRRGHHKGVEKRAEKRQGEGNLSKRRRTLGGFVLSRTLEELVGAWAEGRDLWKEKRKL